MSECQTNSIDRNRGIPESHADLLQSTVDVVLTTVSPAGYPQSTLMWCSCDGKHVLLNTGVGYQKERNMRRNHRVSVFAYDERDHLRWIKVQGDVALIKEGSVEHLNKLSLEYTGKGDFYKEVMPELADREVRVIVRVTPIKIRVGNGVKMQSVGVKSG